MFRHRGIGAFYSGFVPPLTYLPSNRLTELEMLFIRYRNSPEDTDLPQRIVEFAQRGTFLATDPKNQQPLVAVDQGDLILLMALCAAAPRVAQMPPSERAAYADSLHGLPQAIRNPKLNRREFGRIYLAPFFRQKHPELLSSETHWLLTRWLKPMHRPRLGTLLSITTTLVCLTSIGWLASPLVRTAFAPAAQNYHLTDSEILTLEEIVEQSTDPKAARSAACRLFMHYRQERDAVNTEIWLRRLKAMGGGKNHVLPAGP